ncbi:MAG: hypothetical protein ISS19_03005 [Bacteroidales bacterium]|nr:hypothetical protein [Bacteroidales bacterium]
MYYLIGIAIGFGITGIISAILVTSYLDKRNIKTPFPFIGVLLFRNLSLYKKTTREESGSTGSLFYIYLISMNTALVVFILFLIFGI